MSKHLPDNTTRARLIESNIQLCHEAERAGGS